MGITYFEEKEKRKIIKEKYLLDCPHPITVQEKQILNIQMKTCVCKIITNSSCGTGFFGLIKFPEQQKVIKALFTCYHNLISKDKSKIEKSFKYSIGINETLKEIKLDDSRFVYKNDIFDIIIIEILESDNLQMNSFLEFNDSIYKNDGFEKLKKIIDIKDAYSQVSVYLLHFPKFESLSYSTGVFLNLSDDYEIDHTCSSERGSSGGPIINLADQKVFGIHLGRFDNSNNNAALFIKIAIENFIQKYENCKKIKFKYHNLSSATLNEEDNEKTNKYEIIDENKIELNKSLNNKNSESITIIYNVDHTKNKLKLFHEDFVKSNKYLQIIINGLSINICSEIDIDLFAKDKDILEIKLKDVNKIKSMFSMFAKCNDIISLPDIDKWNTSNVIDMRGIFWGCDLLQKIPDISKLNTENVIDIGEMFEGCFSLVSLPDISNWNTSNTINFSKMFSGCIKLQSLPDISKWNTSKVKNIYRMFDGCKNLQSIPDISKWDISNVKNMSYLFFGCENLLSLPENISKWNTTNVFTIDDLFACLHKVNNIPDISNWNISNVIYMESLFKYCKSIKSLPDISKWNTSKVKDMGAIFAGCVNLISLPDISKWDVSNVVDMSQMFIELKKITSLPDISKWNTKNVTTLERMFGMCQNLIFLPDISKWDISKVKDLKFMFGGCINLQELPDISKWNTKNVTNMEYMFFDCRSLTSLPKIENWDINNLKEHSNMFLNVNSNIHIPEIFGSDENILINPLFMTRPLFMPRPLFMQRPLFNYVSFFRNNSWSIDDPYALNNNFNILDVNENINGFFDEEL